jgi:hypothetical protein
VDVAVVAAVVADVRPKVESVVNVQIAAKQHPVKHARNAMATPSERIARPVANAESAAIVVREANVANVANAVAAASAVPSAPLERSVQRAGNAIVAVIVPSRPMHLRAVPPMHACRIVARAVAARLPQDGPSRRMP